MKIRYLIKVIAILFLTSTMTSCTLLLGVHKRAKWLSDEDEIVQAEKFNVSLEYNLIMDSIEYTRAWKNLYQEIFDGIDTAKDSSEYLFQKNVAKDDMQPVQFRLFDASGSEIFKIVNCYVDKPLSANWNVDGCFDVFPPSISDMSLNTHNYDLDFLLACAYVPISKNQLSLDDLPKTDYYGVIMWNDIYYKYSKKLIKHVHKNIEKSDKSVTLIYMSNHNYQIWNSVSSETQKEIKIEPAK